MIVFYADEDISFPLVKALRRQGITITTTAQYNMLGKTDEGQLNFASSHEMVLLSHNVKDFVQLHHRHEHAGIVVSKKASLGILLRKILHLHSTLRQEDMKNKLEYLGNW